MAWRGLQGLARRDAPPWTTSRARQNDWPAEALYRRGFDRTRGPEWDAVLI